METLNDKFCKVTGLTWDLSQYIASLKSKGMSDEQISEKILWLVPDGTMLDDQEGRKAVFTKELLSDETLAELGIDENAKFSPDEESEEDEHESVDLGLSVKWATMNIGANSPEEAGLYFAWGETSGYTTEQVGNEEGKRAFTWNDYEWGNPDSGTLVTDALIDSDDCLLADYDAAVVNWGNGWRMPTGEEFRELIENMHTIFTQQNGVSGLLVTSELKGYEGNSVFFPAVGNAADGDVYYVENSGEYLSASLNGSDFNSVLDLYFTNGDCEVDTNTRYRGFSVRPVRDK